MIFANRVRLRLAAEILEIQGLLDKGHVAAACLKVGNLKKNFSNVAEAAKFASEIDARICRLNLSVELPPVKSTALNESSVIVKCIDDEAFSVNGDGPYELQRIETILAKHRQVSLVIQKTEDCSVASVAHILTVAKSVGFSKLSLVESDKAKR